MNVLDWRAKCYVPAKDFGDTAIGDLEDPRNVTGSGTRVC